MGMEFKELPLVVYHATTTEHKDSLNSGINLNIGRDRVDFGKGFYTTSNIIQAEKWAKSKADFKIKENEISNQKEPIKVVEPLIIKYKINLDKLFNLKGKIFKDADIEWAKYVADNRLNARVDSWVDYTYGPLADARIAVPLHKYKEGKIDIYGFWQEVKPKNDFHTDQMSFHTIDSIKCLERSD